MIIDELIAKLSFDFDDKDLKKFDEGMKSATKLLAGVAVGAAAAATAMFAFTAKIAEQNDAVGKLAQTIGISAKSLNELGFVAQFNGGSIDSMNSSLVMLSRRISETVRGTGEGMEIFKQLGINVKNSKGEIKDTDLVFLEIAESISKLNSQAQKIEYLDKLGMDESMLLTMEQGAQAILNQRKEVEDLGFVLDKEATEAAAKFNDEMLRVGIAVKGVSSAVGTKLMKAIQPMIKLFVEWFKVNKEIIHQNIMHFFERLTSVLSFLFNIGVRVMSVINSLVQALGGWETALAVLGTAWLILYGKMLILPAIIIAISAVLFLLLEDFIAFAEGADSQLGALAKKFPVVGKAAHALIDIFKMVRDGWGLIFTDGEAALDGLIIIIKRIKNIVKEFIMTPIREVQDLFNKGFNLDISGLASDLLKLPASSTQQPMAPGQTVPALATAPANHSNITNNGGGVTINIVDGGDLPKIKQAVTDALSNEFKATELNMSTPERF